MQFKKAVAIRIVRLINNPNVIHTANVKYVSGVILQKNVAKYEP